MNGLNKRTESVKAIAEQAGWMVVAAGLVAPSLAVLPLTLALRNYCEKLPVEMRYKHPVSKVHECLAGAGVFSAFTLIQGPGIIYAELKKLKNSQR